MELRVTYDRSADAAYIYLTQIAPGQVRYTVEAKELQVLLHFDSSERLVGIEVLQAKRTLPRGVIDAAEALDG